MYEPEGFNKRYNPINESSIIFNRALLSFDRLIIDHGYTFKELDSITRMQAKTHDNIADIHHAFTKLAKHCYRMNIKRIRSTSDIQELCEAYNTDNNLNIAEYVDDRKYIETIAIRECRKYRGSYAKLKERRERRKGLSNG